MVNRGMIFHSPPGTPEARLKQKVSWRSIVKMESSKPYHDRHWLMVVTKYEEALLFEFQSKKVLDMVKVLVKARMSTI